MYEDIGLEQAWRLLQEHSPSLRHEVVSATAALGRILAQTVYAGQDLPPQAQSAVDGYALGENHGTDNTPYVLCGSLSTAESASAVLDKGHAKAVNTGGVLPLGTVAVIPHEKVSVKGEHLYLLGKVKPGDCIKRAGEDFARNERLLTAGTQVDPTALGLFAAFGIDVVEVLERPRVAIICLADNIVPRGIEPGSGQMRDSNGPMLSGFVSEQGGITVALHYPPHTGKSVNTLLQELSRQTELVLLVGGTYQDGENTSRSLMEDAGARVIFWGVSIQPGSHAGAGKLGNCLLLSLSGNPAACAVNYHLYAAQVMRNLQGMPWYYRQVTARCRNGFPKKTGSRRFVRGSACWQNNGWEVEVLPGQKPSMLRSWLGCNALIDLPPGSGPIAEGEEVRVLLLTDYTVSLVED